MKKIKDFIETNFGMEIIPHSGDDVEYLITPMFSVIKYNGKYALSFGIEIDKKIAFDLYIDLGHHFLNEIDFSIYEDCLIKYNTFTGELEYFCFGEQAKTVYFNEIFRDMTTQASIPKEAVFH